MHAVHERLRVRLFLHGDKTSEGIRFFFVPELPQEA